jgi:hypothetical protein
MSLLRRKSEPERLADTVTESLDVVRRHGVSKSTLVKAGVVAGGVAALTAGSAAVSSLRRRLEGSS